MSFFLKNLILFNKKGFIGAIGDDLPSIIPIVIALMLFFSVFSSTLTTYNNRNADFRQKIEIISVARELKGNSLLLGTTSFEKSCNNIKIRPRSYSFIAAIYPANHDVGQIFAYNDSENYDFIPFNEKDIIQGSITNTSLDDYELDPSDKQYLCSYRSIGSGEFTGKQKSYIIQFYPVAVQKTDPFNNTLIVPAIMAVVVWK